MGTMGEIHAADSSVFIHALKYDIDNNTHQACFYVDEIPEEQRDAYTVAPKLEKKFLWQSQKWLVTIYNEAELTNVNNTKKCQRNIYKRTLKRRTKGAEEGNTFEVSEVFSVIPHQDQPSNAGRKLREFIWTPKEVNIEESYILVTYTDNEIGEGDSLINESTLSKSFTASYAASQSVFDDFEVTYDQSDVIVDDNEEPPAGALARLTYISEKLIHVTQLHQEGGEEKYKVNPLNIRLQYEEPKLWVDPYEGNYGMETSHFQVSERHGDSMESSLLQIKSRAGGYLSDFSYSFSDMRRLKRFRKHHMFERHKYNDIPSDAVVIDALKVTSRGRHLSSSSSDIQQQNTKVAEDHEDDDEEFEDLSIEVTPVTHDTKPTSKQPATPPEIPSVDSRNTSTPTLQALKDETLYKELSVAVPSTPPQQNTTASAAVTSKPTEHISVSKPAKMNIFQTQNMNGDVNDSGYDDSESSPNHPHDQNHASMSYDFDSDENSDIEELKKTFAHESEYKKNIISNQPDDEIVQPMPSTRHSKSNKKLLESESHHAGFCVPINTSVVEILSVNVDDTNNEENHFNKKSSSKSKCLIEEDDISPFIKENKLPDVDLAVLNQQEVHPLDNAATISTLKAEEQTELLQNLADMNDDSLVIQDDAPSHLAPLSPTNDDIMKQFPADITASSSSIHYEHELQDLKDLHSDKQNERVVYELDEDENVLPTPPKPPTRKKYAPSSIEGEPMETPTKQTKLLPAIMIPVLQPHQIDDSTNAKSPLASDGAIPTMNPRHTEKSSEILIEELQIEPTVKEDTEQAISLDSLDKMNLKINGLEHNKSKNFEYIYSDYTNNDHIHHESPSEAVVMATATSPLLRRKNVASDNLVVNTANNKSKSTSQKQVETDLHEERSDDDTNSSPTSVAHDVEDTTSLITNLQEERYNDDDRENKAEDDGDDDNVLHYSENNVDPDGARSSISLQMKPKRPVQSRKGSEMENFLDDDTDDFDENSDTAEVLVDATEVHNGTTNIESHTGNSARGLTKKKSFASKTKKFVLKKLRPKTDSTLSSTFQKDKETTVDEKRDSTEQLKPKDKNNRKSSFKKISASIKLRKQKDKNETVVKPSELHSVKNDKKGFLGFEKLKFDDDSDELKNVTPVSERLKHFSQEAKHQNFELIDHRRRQPTGIEPDIRAAFRRSRSFDSFLNTAGKSPTDFKYKEEDDDLRERRRRLAGYSYVSRSDIPSQVVKGREYTTEACAKEMEKEISLIKNERKKRLGYASSKSMDLTEINDNARNKNKQRELDLVRVQRQKRLSKYSKSMDISIDVLTKVKDVKPVEIPEIFLNKTSPEIESNGRVNGKVGKLTIPLAFSVSDLTETF